MLVLCLVLLIVAIACGEDSGDSPDDPVSVARIRLGEKANGECIFESNLLRYPVTYSVASEDCFQAVTIGPLARVELEQMREDEPVFWENSLPYRQALIGDWINGECDFSSPAVQAYLEFSEIVSTDPSKCVMIVDLGPVTEKQIKAIQGHGSVYSETAVPASHAPEPGK